MKVKCVWEHNGDDSILYASNFIGAFTRGKSKCEAIGKMSSEISAYLKWKGALTWDVPEPEIIQEKVSTREFDTLKCKKVPQSLETGLFFCQIFIFII